MTKPSNRAHLCRWVQKNFLLFHALLLLAVCQTKAAQGPGYMNTLTVPNEPGWGVADPNIIRYRGYYYLYDTGGDVRVWSSTDLVNWADRGLALTGPVNGTAWAPRVRYYNGTFY